MGRIKAEKLSTADLTAYIHWLQTPSAHHTVGVGNGGTRPPKDKIFVIPFNVDLPPQTFAHGSALQSAVAALETKVANHIVKVLAVGDHAIPLKKYSAARVSQRTGMAPGQAKTSHILSDRQYIPRGGHSLSIPFGKSSATAIEDETGVFEQVLLPLFQTANALPPGESVTLIKEKFVPF